MQQNVIEWQEREWQPNNDDIVEDEAFIDNENASTMNNQPVNKQPAKKKTKKQKSEWTDDETFVLIEIWQNYDILYNLKHPLYSNRDEKAKAAEKVRKQLKEKNIDYTVKE